MADGDITAVRINASGWYAEIDIAGLSVGGAYDFGIGTNNDPAAAKVVFAVTSQGYADDCSATTLSRTVYGTNYKRKAYPDHASADESSADGTLTVLVALSEWIYDPDTLTVSIASGFYTEAAGDGGTANAATTSTYAVTNNSAEAYPKVIANWSWPGYSRITGSSFTVRCVAFHRSAKSGRPVRAVKFTCTDQHSHSVSTIVTTATIDSGMADAVKVIEYIGTISTSTFTQGDVLTCNFIAYPWYGDSGSILDTGDAVNAMPTPLYAPQYYLCDTSGTYGVTVAVVDSSLADDTGGEAVDYANFDPDTTGAYKNIYAAANAIAAYNNTNHSRNNTAAGIIYLKEGSHVWTGGTVSAGGKATGPCWTIVTKFPGATRANVLIASASGTKQISEHLKLEDVKITNSTIAGFTGMDAVLVHRCDIDPTGAATFYQNKILYLTQNNLWSCDEYRPYSIENAPRALIRGNTTQEYTIYAIHSYTILGNIIARQGEGIQLNNSNTAAPDCHNGIAAYNKIKHYNATNASLLLGESDLAETHGNAVVQNVIEQIGTAQNVILWIAADQTTNQSDNAIIWHNTLVGQRANLAYNDYNLNDVTPPVYRKHWHLIGNIFDDYNCITDVDPHGGTANGYRVGNHSIIHGTGLIGNIILNRAGVDGYENKFGGLFYKRGSPLAPNFVDDQSASGGKAGDGDYTLQATSPAIGLAKSYVLPYDLAGVARKTDGTGAIGAYEYVEAGAGVLGSRLLNNDIFPLMQLFKGNNL